MIIDKYTTYYTNIKYQLMPACIAFLKLVPLSTSLPQSSKELNVICGVNFLSMRCELVIQMDASVDRIIYLSRRPFAFLGCDKRTFIGKIGL